MADVGNMRARYRRITRFAARYLVQAWWYELFLPRLGPRRPRRRAGGRRGCSASPSASTCWRSTSAA